MDKKEFDKARSAVRKLKPRFHSACLVHMLINLKTYYGNIYNNKDIVERLREVVSGAKTKDGDVKLYFWNFYNGYIQEPSRCTERHGSRYQGDDPYGGLPF